MWVVCPPCILNVDYKRSTICAFVQAYAGGQQSAKEDRRPVPSWARPYGSILLNLIGEKHPTKYLDLFCIEVIHLLSATIKYAKWKQELGYEASSEDEMNRQ